MAAPALGPPFSETLLSQTLGSDEARTYYRDMVQYRPLILRPTSPDPQVNARARRQYERQQKAKAQRKRPNKPKPLSAKQKRSLGVYDIPKEQQRYAIYEPLHQLWCEYMREVLGIGGGAGEKGKGGNSGGIQRYCDAESAGPILVTADYHGAKMEVVRSRCVSRVGVEGIVIKDTKFTFELITVKNELKCIPKEGTVFRFEVPPEGEQGDELGKAFNGQEVEKKALVFEIYGDRFKTRAPERAVKKVRYHPNPNL